MNFFAYGTLMCEDIMQAVTGEILTGEPGRLHHYRQRILKGETYPGMIPARNETVDGMLYYRLSPTASKRLDVFEGDMYLRPPVEVQTAKGALQPAFTYVLKKNFEDRLSDEPWRLEWFLRAGKKTFEAKYFGFNALNKFS